MKKGGVIRLDDTALGAMDQSAASVVAASGAFRQSLLT